MIKVSGRANGLLLICLLTFSALCHAISFGELKIYSYLGEPLVAEIELTNFKDIDPEIMQVTLSSAEDFKRAGLERPLYLNYLAFDVFTYKDRLFIAIRSPKIIQSPYIEFLLTLAWPNGNLIKEYTILLDPPPPNLSKETRPKSFSSLYTETLQQKSKSFGANGVSEVEAQIQMQKSAEQKALAEESLTNVVREGKNDFSDYTFDSVLPQEKDRVAKLKESAQLVPGVVPEVLNDEEKANREAYAQQLKEFNLKQQQQKAAQQKKQTETKLQKVVGNIAGLKDNIDDVANIEKVLADERKDYSAPTPATPTPATPTPVTQTPATQTPATQTPVSPTPPNQTAQPTANNPAATKTTPVSTDTTEHIDFNVPLPSKPASITSTVPPHTITPPAAVVPDATSTPTPAAVGAPAMSAAPPVKTGNHLYLGWILSLLLLAVGIMFAVKRRINNKPNIITETQADANVDNTVKPLNEKSTEDLFNEPLEDFDMDDADAEHIELISDDQITKEITQTISEQPSTTEANVSSAQVAQFEQEIENIDLDKIDITGPTLVAEVAEEKVDDIVGPTMLQDNHQKPEPDVKAAPINYDMSSLKLSNEGADLIEQQLLPVTKAPADNADNTIDSVSTEYSEELAIKINLAKQYLETGDKSSAKTILEEVVAVAKDEQLLEARMLLSGIIL